MADLDRIERELIWRRTQYPRYAVDDDVVELLAEVRSLREEKRDLAELLELAREEIHDLRGRLKEWEDIWTFQEAR